MGMPREFAWPEGATSAVSLTFDGAYPEHWELVAPILAEHDIRATFFVTVPALLENPEAWRQLVKAGHEIGSHSHLGVSTEGELTAWTLEMVQDDLRLTDKGILEILGCSVGSFALSGEKTQCSEGDYSGMLRSQFSTVRSVLADPNTMADVDLHRVGSRFWRDLIGPVEAFLPSEGEWSVPVFDHFYDANLGAAEEDLRVLLGHLSRRSDIWTAPFGEVAAHILSVRGPAGASVMPG